MLPVEGKEGLFKVPALEGVTVAIGEGGIEVAGLTPEMLLKLP